MHGDSDAPDVGHLAGPPSLGDVSHALDELRESLSRLEGMAAPPPAPPRDAGPAPAVDDGQALGIVQEILSLPSSGIDPRELFTLAMDRASRLLAADRAMLFVAESGGTRLVPRSGHGFRRDDLESISVRPGEGMVGRVFSERRVLTYAGADGEPDAFIERFPVRDALAVPVRGEDDVGGVLYVGRRRLGAPFTANDVLLLLVIADRVSGGLVQQALLDRQSRQQARLTELGEFAATLTARSPDEVLAAACEVGCRLTDARAAVLAMSATGGEAHVAHAWGLPATASPPPPVGIHEGLTAEVYGGAPFAACRDLRSRPGTAPSFLVGGGFRGCLVLPLGRPGSPIGALYLADTEPRDFRAEEIAAAQILASLAALAIDDGSSRPESQAALPAARSAHERGAWNETARALGEMAAGLTREFNDVFATILGKSRLLLARPHDEPLREGLEILEEAAWRGADIVRRLMALASPDSGDDAAGPVDAVALLRDVVAATRAEGRTDGEPGEASIDLVSDLRSAPPVRGSAPALREALAGLVQNAMDAMPHGGRLTVAARPREGGVELAVVDTGEGIADEVWTRVFDPFFTTRGPQRMGLGLTIAQGVLARCGGSIEISSAAGGTRVIVWLPALDAPGARPPAAVTSARATAGPAGEITAAAPAPVAEEDRPRETITGEGGPGGAKLTASGPASILVLEDDPSVRSLLVDALGQAGYAVETDADGSSAVAKFEQGRFDLVLADLALPQRSGLAIARSIKALSPQTPVVLITGWGHLLDPERLREHGVDLMLVKPFRIERVLSVVGDALRLRPTTSPP